MSPEKKHVIISIVLGAVVIATVIGAGIAIQMSGKKGALPVAVPLSSETSSAVTESTPSESASSPEPVSSEEPSSREPVSSDTPASSAPSSMESPSSETISSDAVSSDAVSSETTTSDFVDISGATSVTLFADGQTQALTPEQITQFMGLYLQISMQFVRSEDNTEVSQLSNGGFTIAYQDGRREQFYLGGLYDGTWWSGNDFYEVDNHALALEEYLCQYPIIANWASRSAPADPASQSEPSESPA